MIGIPTANQAGISTLQAVPAGHATRAMSPHQANDIQGDTQCCLVHIYGCCRPQNPDALNQLIDTAQHKRILLFDVLQETDAQKGTGAASVKRCLRA